MDVEGSRDLYDRASRVLAGGVSTAFRMSERPVPLFCREARGAHWVDVDGNEYIDFVCGFGPVILGHGASSVTEAAERAARSIQQVGGQHQTELELAELLCELVPSFEQLRFSVSGSEAVHGAVRLARAATGRSLVVKFAGHYHGWFDGIYVGTSRTNGGASPETAGQTDAAVSDVIVLDWNDLAQLEGVFDDLGERIAAVIMEPLPCNLGLFYPQDGYLDAVRALTKRAGSLLIFDEVITAFRLGLGGAQARFGVEPDLTVVAKAMANGFPISAFGGQRDLMERVATNEVIHAGTYNAGGVSTAAALATLHSLMEDDDAYPRMEKLGQRLMEGLAAIAAGHDRRLVARGPGPVFFTWFADNGVESFAEHLEADAILYARFAEAMLAEGVRIIPAGRWYLSAAHTDEDIDRALDAADRALTVLG